MAWKARRAHFKKARRARLPRRCCVCLDIAAGTCLVPAVGVIKTMFPYHAAAAKASLWLRRAYIPFL